MEQTAPKVPIFERGEPVRLEALELDIPPERLWEALAPPAMGNATPA